MSPNGAFEYIEDTSLWPNNGKFWHEWLDIDTKIKLGKEVFSQGKEFCQLSLQSPRRAFIL